MKRSICLVSLVALMVALGALGCASGEMTRVALGIAKPPPPPPPPPPSALDSNK